MNQKRSILFTLLVFFLIHVEKIHGCHPSGSLDRGNHDCTPGWGMLITIVDLLLFLLLNNSTCEKLMHSFVYIDGVEITDVTWNPNSPELSITVYTPDGANGKNAPQAYGHFSFAIGGKNDHYKFIGKPKFVNTHKCDHQGSDEVNPYTSTYKYDELYKPLNGEAYRIWIAVYWNCIYPSIGGSILCCHRDFVHDGTVKY